jgi:N-acetylglucosaminyl-diphospho-decaprenol L-rhamnosyltransferase
VIVVDNASTDDSASLAEALGAQVIRNSRNEGYGRANNMGARAAQTDFLLICNPDAVPQEGALAKLLEAAVLYPDSGLYAPQIVEPDGRLFFQHQSYLSKVLKNPHHVKSLPEGDCCVPFLSGACFLIRRDLFLEMDGFDEQIFLFYEDDDLCRRLMDNGHAPIHVHGAIACHGRGQSSLDEKGRIYRSRWHQAWSKVYIARKYGLPSPVFGMMVRNGLKLLFALLLFRRSKIERYAGSFAGSWAALRRKSSLGDGKTSLNQAEISLSH